MGGAEVGFLIDDMVYRGRHFACRSFASSTPEWIEVPRAWHFELGWWFSQEFLVRLAAFVVQAFLAGSFGRFCFYPFFGHDQGSSDQFL